MFSAVVPAYNEAAVIHRSLEPLSQLAAELDGEVVVVPNGCHDNTAEVASRFNGVTVLATEKAGKTGALNLGDSRCQSFPRLYMDSTYRLSLAICGP